MSNYIVIIETNMKILCMISIKITPYHTYIDPKKNHLASSHICISSNTNIAFHRKKQNFYRYYFFIQ